MSLPDFIVVGGGVSGIHAAQTLLERGRSVELWDVGRDEDALMHPQADFEELKGLLPDPQAYFLGEDDSGIVPPGRGELQRYPPSRTFLARTEDPLWPYDSEGGFRPSASFHTGGLARGWGVNALCFSPADIADWPSPWEEWRGAYERAFGRIPVSGPGPDDPLAAEFPALGAASPPIELNCHDAKILSRAIRDVARLEDFGIRIGRARLAVSRDGGPRGCVPCGRCLWGCPRNSLYDPSKDALEACRRYAAFRLRTGRMVADLVTEEGRAVRIRFFDTETGRIETAPCGKVVLAAGALQTGAILLRTLRRDPRAHGWGEDLSRTAGLMDTPVVKIPYVIPRGIGASWSPKAFQFNRLIWGQRIKEPGELPGYLHGELLSLTTLLYHPLIEALPFGSRLSSRLVFLLAPALGTLTLFFPDNLRPENALTLREEPEHPLGDRVVPRYAFGRDQERVIPMEIVAAQQALKRLGCVPWSSRPGEPGAGIHYAGTWPAGSGIRNCDASGRTRAYENVYVADGAWFPSLPSKSITMSLVANAIRVAEKASS